jgi:hypothetical protein
MLYNLNGLGSATGDGLAHFKALYSITVKGTLNIMTAFVPLWFS